MPDAVSGNRAKGQELATSIVHTVMSWHLDNDPEAQAQRLQELHGFAQEYRDWLLNEVIDKIGADS